MPYVDYAQDYNLPMHISSNGQLPNGNLSLTRNRELRQDNGLPSIQSGMGSLSAGLMSKSFFLSFSTFLQKQKKTKVALQASQDTQTHHPYLQP